MSLSQIKVNNSSVIGVDSEPIAGSRNLVESGAVSMVKDISRELTSLETEIIQITDDNGTPIHIITESNANFHGLLNDGVNVLAIELIQKSLETSVNDEVQITKNNNELIAKINNSGIFSKGFFYLDGTSISGFPLCIVEPNGKGDYTTINEALNHTSDGDTILLMPGVYNEAVRMNEKDRHLVGFNRETVIITNDTGLRATPPLEANIGSVENLTIYAAPGNLTEDDEIGKSYGVHVECAHSTPYTLVFRNCKIGSRLQAGIGMGLRFNQTVIVDNCEVYSEASKSWSTAASIFQDTGGFFFHNDTGNHGDQYIGRVIIKDSYLHGVKAALSVGCLDNGSKAELIAINNTLYSETYGVDSRTFLAMSEPTVGNLVGAKISLGVQSHGNNNNTINN